MSDARPSRRAPRSRARRPRAPRSAAAGACLALAALASPTARAVAEEGPRAGAVALEGTWYVLTHYRDRGASDPGAWHWEDRIWVFEREEAALRWTVYPVVVFRDESGRFENLGTNRARRLRHAWEPDEGQRREIAEGLRVNAMGSRTKRLRPETPEGEGQRGSGAGGWVSARPAPQRSARVFGYHEMWSVRRGRDGPVFERRDRLGGAGGAAGLEGVTRFAAERIAEGGERLEGRYLRDERRRGRFAMWRAGAVAGVGTTRSQSERLREHFGGQLGVPFGEGDPVPEEPGTAPPGEAP